MTDKIIYWSTVIVSFIALLLFVANVSFVSGNRQLQEDASRRQNAITNAANLTPLNQNLAQALAEISVKNNDPEIRDLLATQGIAIRQPDAAKATATGDDATTKKKK